jgi:glycosyltransferase involved in cell wall biosynthesis
MKVLYASHWFMPYSLALVNSLAERHDVCLLTTSRSLRSLDPERARDLIDPRIRLEIEPDTRERQAQPIGYYFAALRNLKRLLRDWKPDVFHVQESADMLLAWTWLRALRARPTRFVVTVHDPEPHKGDEHRLWWLRQRYIHAVRHRADKVVALAEYNRERLLALHPEISPERIAVVQHPAMEFYRAYVPAEAQQVRGSVLFFGRMVAYKGLGTLAEAWKLVRDRVPYATLTIAGRGPDLAVHGPRLEQDPRVRVLDTYLSNEEVARLFTAASAVALPYSEATQSGVLATALAFGRASVVTNVGGLPEMVEDGVSALVVPPRDPEALADALTWVLTEDTLRTSLEQGARARALGALSGAALSRQIEQAYIRD